MLSFLFSLQLQSVYQKQGRASELLLLCSSSNLMLGNPKLDIRWMKPTSVAKEVCKSTTDGLINDAKGLGVVRYEGLNC